MANVTIEGELVESHALVKVDAIVKPAVSPEAALQAWEDYQHLKKRIAHADDFQKIQGKDFPKKSLWRKLATFFNLTLEVVTEKEIKNEDGTIDFDVVYRAVAPNGRSTIGDGSCNSHEKKGRSGDSIGNSRHNTRSTAHTRAFNRAVSNLIGGGEVSAEEVEAEDFRFSAPASNPPTPPKDLDDYKIDLGNLKDGKSHWLNNKTMKQADEMVDKVTHTSELRRTYDYYKKNTFRNGLITEFMKYAEIYFTQKDKG